MTYGKWREAVDASPYPEIAIWQAFHELYGFVDPIYLNSLLIECMSQMNSDPAKKREFDAFRFHTGEAYHQPKKAMTVKERHAEYKMRKGIPLEDCEH